MNHKWADVMYLYVLVCCICACIWSCVCFSCVFMWVWVLCNFYQRDQLLTGRAKVSSWPSHHALSVGSLECAGMWVRTGGEVLLRDRHPDTTSSSSPFLFPSFSPSTSLSSSTLHPVFKVPSHAASEEWMSGNRSALFLSVHGERRRNGGRQTGEKRLI